MKFKHIIFLAIFTAIFSTKAVQAIDFTVVSVYKSFPMRNGEEGAKDYYINAGSQNGLKQGAIMEAMRRMSVHDNQNAKVLGDTRIPVAKLQIIHVDKNSSIARLVKMLDRKENPNPIFEDVMSGDFVRVSQTQD